MARNAPSMPVCSASMKNTYCFTRVEMSYQEASRTMGSRNVVRITRKRLMPSIPT